MVGIFLTMQQNANKEASSLLSFLVGSLLEASTNISVSQVNTAAFGEPAAVSRSVHTVICPDVARTFSSATFFVLTHLTCQNYSDSSSSFFSSLSLLSRRFLRCCPRSPRPSAWPAAASWWSAPRSPQPEWSCGGRSEWSAATPWRARSAAVTRANTRWVFPLVAAQNAPVCKSRQRWGKTRLKRFLVGDQSVPEGFIVCIFAN